MNEECLATAKDLLRDENIIESDIKRAIETIIPVYNYYKRVILNFIDRCAGNDNWFDIYWTKNEIKYTFNIYDSDSINDLFFNDDTLMYDGTIRSSQWEFTTKNGDSFVIPDKLFRMTEEELFDYFKCIIEQANNNIAKEIKVLNEKLDKMNCIFSANEYVLKTSIIMNKKIAVYPGSFNPFTKGHENILRKALKIFDKVYVVYSINTNKTKTVDECELQNDQRKRLDQIPGVTTYTNYCSLTVDICKEVGATHIIRGIRNSTDYEYENNIARINKILAPHIETIFITPDKTFEDISSSMVRELKNYNKDVSQFIF